MPARRSNVVRVEALKGRVVVTRESGKNAKLAGMVEAAGLESLEMPLIETVVGPDRALLPTVMREETFDWVVLTSPEAAAVFVEGWIAAKKPNVNVAVVGQGTAEALHGTGVEVQFVPPLAHAVSFSAELPLPEGRPATILYPSSALAATTLQAGLEARGCIVKRLNTYSTVKVTSVPSDVLSLATTSDVVTIGSPSAVKAWVHVAGMEVAADIPLACIGETSAIAAKKLGLSQVFYPEAPGMEGWMDAIREALEAKATAGSVP